MSRAYDIIQVNCPKAGVAFFNKLDIKGKKLIVYDVGISMHARAPVLQLNDF